MSCRSHRSDDLKRMTPFEHAVQQLTAARVPVGDDLKLQLYALFKQATLGDCGASAPSAFRVVERAKWTSWRKLQGTRKEEAERQYVALVQTLLPSFQVTETARPRREEMRPEPEQAADAGHSSGAGGVILAWLVVGAATLLVAVKVLRVGEKTMEMVQYEDLGQSLSPLLWFAVGYLVVILLRSKSAPWPKGLWFSTATPRRRSRRRRRPAPAESEIDAFLRKHGIQIVRGQEAGNIVPRLVLKLPEDAEASQFGDCHATISYTVEQTADVYYRKFKEPLPDPASRLLHSIEVLEERHLDEYCAVFKRRLLRFRNEAPSLIKRFASSDFVEYIEDSLLDKQNRLFYVHVKNESFQSLGVLEDFALYKVHADKSHWTDLHQFCRVHITSSSLSFFRSKIENFISSFYCKNAPDARAYHLQRITEEFGDPVE